MATKGPARAGSSSHQAREASPFFSLPNEDGSNPHPGYDSDQSQHSQQYQPITLSCAGCERIVGDSSAFLCATRQMGAITLDRMVSVTVGPGGLKTSMEGKWDEFCNYKDITCGKCSTALGKMYFATTSKLSALQNKYTVDITALSFYHHASNAPSLPIAATSEIYAQLHPSPEALAGDIGNVMTICVMLRDEQENIMRELKKLGQVTGVDVDLEDGGTSGEGLDVKESWRERVEALEGKVREMGKRVWEEGKPEHKTITARQERGTQVEEGVLLPKEGGKPEHKTITTLQERGTQVEEGALLPKEDKQPWKKSQQDIIVTGDIVSPPPPGPRRQEKEPQKAPPPAAVNKRKRKSGAENVTTTTATKQIYIDLSGAQEDDEPSAPHPAQPQHKRKSKKEIPNSQSADEAEKEGGTTHEEDGEFREEGDGQEEGEEAIEDQIKSAAEKRRKAMVVPTGYRKVIAGKRILQRRKGKQNL